MGTILASVSTSLHDLNDDATLLDSPLAPFFYGGLSRGFLESMVVGQSADSVPAECLAALTVDNGQISGVAANPSPDAVKACTGLSSSSSSSSGTGEGVVVGSEPIPEQPPQTPSPDEGAPPATVALTDRARAGTPSSRAVALSRDPTGRGNTPGGAEIAPGQGAWARKHAWGCRNRARLSPK